MAVKDELETLLDELEPQARRAFLEAVANITDDVVLQALVDRIAAGDLEGAVAIVSAQPVVFNPLIAVYTAAYTAGGELAAAGVRDTRTPNGARMVLRFDVRNLQAEDWLRKESSRLVRGLTSEVRESVREHLSVGMSRGLNPKTVALDVVGRVNKFTGRREGGVIGLSVPQASYVQNARDELLSGDPTLMAHYFTRTRRDARLDGLVRKAIAAGKPLDRDTVNRIVGRYSDRLLQLRGETIARTEMLVSLHSGQAEAMRQAIASGSLRPDQIVKIWQTASDARVRHSHFVLGQKGGTRVPYDKPFVSPATGARMMHPGDRSLGALPEDVVNCRCHARYKVDYLASLARRERERA